MLAGVVEDLLEGRELPTVVGTADEPVPVFGRTVDGSQDALYENVPAQLADLHHAYRMLPAGASARQSKGPAEPESVPFVPMQTLQLDRKPRSSYW